MAPRWGRFFTEKDAYEGNDRIAVLHYSTARDLFGKAEEALGQSIRLNDEYFEIIGILPRDFRAMKWAEVYIPFVKDERGFKNDASVALKE